MNENNATKATAKPAKIYVVNAATAFDMWNSGKTLTKIAAAFPNATIWQVRAAIHRAARAGRGVPRFGEVKKPVSVPPFIALWQATAGKE